LDPDSAGRTTEKGAKGERAWFLPLALFVANNEFRLDTLCRRSYDRWLIALTEELKCLVQA
jgi:hypothetical protein